MDLNRSARERDDNCAVRGFQNMLNAVHRTVRYRVYGDTLRLCRPFRTLTSQRCQNSHPPRVPADAEDRCPVSPGSLTPVASGRAPIDKRSERTEPTRTHRQTTVSTKQQMLRAQPCRGPLPPKLYTTPPHGLCGICLSVKPRASATPYRPASCALCPRITSPREVASDLPPPRPRPPPPGRGGSQPPQSLRKIAVGAAAPG